MEDQNSVKENGVDPNPSIESKDDPSPDGDLEYELEDRRYCFYIEDDEDLNDAERAFWLIESKQFEALLDKIFDENG